MLRTCLRKGCLVKSNFERLSFNGQRLGCKALPVNRRGDAKVQNRDLTGGGVWGVEAGESSAALSPPPHPSTLLNLLLAPHTNMQGLWSNGLGVDMQAHLAHIIRPFANTGCAGIATMAHSSSLGGGEDTGRGERG